MRARAKASAIFCVLGILGVAVVLQAGAEGRSAKPPVPRPARPALKAKGTAPTRLQVDVFEISCTSEQFMTLDLDQVGADEAAAQQVLERLGAFGQARVLSRLDDVGALPGEIKIVAGHRAPVVQDVAVGKGRVVTPSVNYQEVGSIVEVSGQWVDTDEAKNVAQLRLDVEFSGIGQSYVVLPSKIKLPVFSECSIEKSLLITSGKPVLTLMNLVANPTDEEKRVIAYVVRTVVTRIQP